MSERMVCQICPYQLSCANIKPPCYMPKPENPCHPTETTKSGDIFKDNLNCWCKGHPAPYPANYVRSTTLGDYSFTPIKIVNVKFCPECGRELK